MMPLARHLDVTNTGHHDNSMRTTLTLDNDLAEALQEQALLLGISFKQVVNDTLRRGLSPKAQEERPVFRVKPLSGGFRPGVDPLKLNQLNDELEVQEFLDKHN